MHLTSPAVRAYGFNSRSSQTVENNELDEKMYDKENFCMKPLRGDAMNKIYTRGEERGGYKTFDAACRLAKLRTLARLLSRPAVIGMT